MVRVRRKTLTFLMFISLFIVIAVILLWSPRGSSRASISRSVSIGANQKVADRFSYGGSGIDQSMATGCNVPASLSLNIADVKSSGRVKIYINDFYVGYADITSKGEAMITSGCGCSTSCICTIKGGDNTVILESEGFAGDITYKVVVK